MHCPTLAELPPPPDGRTGWPWTVETPRLPPARPDGSPWPRISVVTPSYNQGQFIEEAIRSILLQGYPDLEYIVIDGGSTDQSVEIIKKYEPWLTHWVSEKDRGQAHAINKGLVNVTGELFNWINSDDLLIFDALAIVGAVADDEYTVAGGVENFGQGEPALITNKNLVSEKIISGDPEAVFHQPGFWWSIVKLRKIGNLDDSFNFTFDLDLVIRYVTIFPRIIYVNAFIAKFRLHRNSKTVSLQDKFHEERLLIYRKLLSDPRYARLHEFCNRRLRAYTWWDRLAAIRNSDESRFLKAIQIIIAMCEDPKARFSRLSAGALRRTLAW